MDRLQALLRACGCWQRGDARFRPAVFQGFLSYLLPCFAVDHLYLSHDQYLLSEEETPVAEGKETANVLV